LLICGSVVQAEPQEGEDLGFLCNPPVYIENQPDIPLVGLGPGIPARGEIIPAGDISSVDSDEFRKNGENVQPALNVESDVIRLDALRGFGDGWAAGISLPWVRTKVRGEIGGFDSSGTADGLGDISLYGKKRIWCKGNSNWVLAAGLELPLGKDDVTFAQSNAATNAYYVNSPLRMPLGWQAGSGTWDGYLGASYRTFKERISFAFLLATKLNSSGDEDVKIGNAVIAAGSATYGISKSLAAALGLTARFQADDSYPNAPLPGVDAPPVEGTTLNGTLVTLNPSIRYSYRKTVTVGVGYSIPIVKPDDGMVPQALFTVIFYPSF